MGEICLGTSGWSYKEWVGPFYEREERKFSFYTRFFKTSEINSTFYRYPTRSMVFGWLRSSPSDFTFAAKLPRLITHKKKLRMEERIDSDLIRFLDLMEPLRLNRKLGPILIQLPPRFTYTKDAQRLEEFLEILPGEFRFAVEFRHPSWMRDDTWQLFKEHNVAYTVVDEPLLPPEVHLTADFTYFRWHGRGRRPWYDYHYEEEELRPWAAEVREAGERVETVYGYFNNHYHGYAVENCVQILEMLGMARPEQVEAKERVIEHNLSLKKERVVGGLEPTTLLDFDQMGLEETLLMMTDRRRLNRARRIGDEELSIREASDERIEARIRRYTILIDLKKRLILHDCADWTKGIATKRLCKHIGKLLLSLPEEDALRMVRRIYRERDEWKFETIVV
ncbi:MAG: DUF72 domain-containing protein [Candidatus Bathyarchaeia archaeon]